jgi:imidazolonepropionase-like amidohydrolase
MKTTRTVTPPSSPVAPASSRWASASARNADLSGRWRSTLGAAALALACTLAPAQDLGIKAPAQDHTVAISGATIHPVSGDPIPGGTIVFEDGRITHILEAGMAIAFEPGTRVVEIDAQGLHVYPGLISPYSQLGLTEIQAVRATLDFAETQAMMPEVRAAVAVNPDSTLLPVTRSNGILLAGVFPRANLRLSGAEPRGLIPGRAAVMRLDGWTWEDMAVLDDAGLAVNFPLSRPVRAWWMDQDDEDQAAGYQRAVDMLDAFFREARAYHAAKHNGDNPPADLRYEAVARVLPRTNGQSQGRTSQPPTAQEGGLSGPPTQLPTFFLANDYDQITEALAFAAEHGLRPVIVGGRDAHLCLDALRAADAPVILETSFRMPKRDDSPYDDNYRRPAQLEEAGITYSLLAGDDTAHERSLPYAVALAVAHGLPAEAGVRALTLSAAEIFGIDADYGSLETGKSATLIVTTGHPLDVLSNVELAFIDGRAIDLENKHTALAAKYREKYRQLGLLEREE